MNTCLAVHEMLAVAFKLCIDWRNDRLEIVRRKTAPPQLVLQLRLGSSCSVHVGYT